MINVLMRMYRLSRACRGCYNLTEFHNAVPDESFWRLLDFLKLREGYLWLMEELDDDPTEDAA